MSLRPYPINAEVVKIKLSDNGNAPRLWHDFEFGNPMAISTFFEDFQRFVAGDWTVTETDAGATEALTDEANGALLITNTAADNDLVSIQKVGESFLPALNRTIWFEARFKVSDATQSDVVVGLMVTDTTPLAHANGIVFRKDDGDTDLDFASTASSVSSQESVIGTLSNDTYIKVGFKVIGLEKIEFYVNGEKKGDLTSNIPTTELRPTIAIQNGEAVAKTMTIDCINVAQTRETN